MKSEEYTAVTERVRVFGGLAMQFDVEQLQEALRAIDRSNTVGPLLNPSAWSAAHERMDALADLIRAVIRLRKATGKFLEVMEQTEPKARRARADAAAILGVEVDDG